ncbi:hypothetical protein AB0H00_31525 [Nocardia sp. NPDC023852]|uniref:hypothetical protein n=1 Tax=Nocardia sp. NPDC023852 TaxID=3154697 RepID=UPI0033F38DA9
MENSRAKIAGPAIAAGAVSIGLVLIGACGVGRHDTYVPPPPLKAGEYVEPAAHEGATGSTTPRVIIPPSPTWKIAPYQQRPATPFSGFSSSTTTSAESSPRILHDGAAPEDSRPPISTRPAAVEPPVMSPNEPAANE